MGKKTAKLTPADIKALSNDKPVVYIFKNKNGSNIYTGSAKRGRVQARILEHLKGPGEFPGAASVEIRQFPTIGDAEKSESRIIKLNKPKFNKAGK